MRTRPLPTRSLILALSALPAWANQQSTTCQSSPGAGQAACVQKADAAATAECQDIVVKAGHCALPQTPGASCSVNLVPNGSEPRQSTMAVSASPVVIVQGEPLQLHASSLNTAGLGLAIAGAMPGALSLGPVAGQDFQRGFMGVTIQYSADAITIQSVFPGSPAEQAGLRPGDRIVQLEGEAISSAEQVAANLQNKGVAEKLSLRVDRDGWTRDLTLVLAPANATWNVAGNTPETAELEALEVVEGVPLDFRTLPEPTPSEGDAAIEVFRMPMGEGVGGTSGIPSCEAQEDATRQFKVHVQDHGGAAGESHGPRRIRIVMPDGSSEEHAMEGIWLGDDGEHTFTWSTDGQKHESAETESGHKKVIRHNLNLPGGKCEIEVRLEGDLQSSDLAEHAHKILKGLNLSDLNVVQGHKLEGLGAGPHIFTWSSDSEAGACDEACKKACEEACKKACTGEQAEANSDQECEVMVLGSDASDSGHSGVYVMRTPSAHTDGEIRVHGFELPAIAEKVQAEIRAQAQGEKPRVLRRRVLGGDDAGNPQSELEQLRAELAELRGMRQELSELQSLRAELKELLRSLHGKQH